MNFSSFEAKAQYVNHEELLKKKSIIFRIIFVIDIKKSKFVQLNECEDFQNKLTRNENEKHLLFENNDQSITNNLKVLENNETNKNQQKSVFKLLLQDLDKNFCYGYEFGGELSFLKKTNSNDDSPLSIKLGGRLIVNQGTTVEHGVILLNDNNCKYLGIDESDKLLSDNLNNDIIKKYIKILKLNLENQN